MFTLFIAINVLRNGAMGFEGAAGVVLPLAEETVRNSSSDASCISVVSDFVS
jgi:hypothetical protein